MATARKPVGEPPVLAAPPPWTVKSELYCLILRLKSLLPVDMYGPLEASGLTEATNDFQGGWGFIMVIRYSDTPVGSYEQLLIVPGAFKVPGGKDKGKSHLRSRINWNVPKHMARFEFSALMLAQRQKPHVELKVAVYPPKGDKAFFRATLTPAKWLPGLPISWLPSFSNTTTLPPFPAGDQAILCGSTETWKTVYTTLGAKRARIMWVDVETAGQEGYWPNVKPWSWGVMLEEVEATLVDADEFTI